MTTSTNRLIVMVSPGFDLATVLPPYATILRFNATLSYYTVQTEDEQLDGLVEHLRSIEGILDVEKDTLLGMAYTPTDPLWSSQWQLAASGYAAVWDITRGNPAIKVAIVDSGVEDLHEDLIGQVAEHWRLDGSNYEQVKFIVYPNNSVTYGHGTASAGMIAAKGDNNLGTHGIAPLCPLISLMTVDPVLLLHSFGDVIEAITVAVDRGCKVVNLSVDPFYLGASAIGRAARDYAEAANVILVWSGGNDHVEPAFTMDDKVIYVGAGSPDGTKDWYSNYGSKIDIFNYGTSVIGPALMYNQPTVYNHYAGYGGTSCAAPLTSGMIALMRSVYPTMTNDETRRVVRATSLNSAISENQWFGFVNPLLAVQVSKQLNDSGQYTGDDVFDFEYITSNSSTIYISVRSITAKTISAIRYYVNGVLKGSKTTGISSIDRYSAGVTVSGVDNGIYPMTVEFVTDSGSIFRDGQVTVRTKSLEFIPYLRSQLVPSGGFYDMEVGRISGATPNIQGIMRGTVYLDGVQVATVGEIWDWPAVVYSIPVANFPAGDFTIRLDAYAVDDDDYDFPNYTISRTYSLVEGVTLTLEVQNLTSHTELDTLYLGSDLVLESLESSWDISSVEIAPRTMAPISSLDSGTTVESVALVPNTFGFIDGLESQTSIEPLTLIFHTLQAVGNIEVQTSIDSLELALHRIIFADDLHSTTSIEELSLARVGLEILNMDGMPISIYNGHEFNTRVYPQITT